MHQKWPDKQEVCQKLHYIPAEKGAFTRQHPPCWNRPEKAPPRRHLEQDMEYLQQAGFSDIVQQGNNLFDPGVLQTVAKAVRKPTWYTIPWWPIDFRWRKICQISGSWAENATDIEFCKATVVQVTMRASGKPDRYCATTSTHVYVMALEFDTVRLAAWRIRTSALATNSIA